MANETPEEIEAIAKRRKEEAELDELRRDLTEKEAKKNVTSEPEDKDKIPEIPDQNKSKSSNQSFEDIIGDMRKSNNGKLNWSIAGSRSIIDKKGKISDEHERNIFNIFTRYIQPGDTVITNGDKGVGALTKKYSKEEVLHHEEVLPEWGAYKKEDNWMAPLAGNTVLVDRGQVVLAIWDKKSKGTGSVIKEAMDQGKEVIVFSPKGERIPVTYDEVKNYGIVFSAVLKSGEEISGEDFKALDSRQIHEDISEIKIGKLDPKEPGKIHESGNVIHIPEDKKEIWKAAANENNGNIGKTIGTYMSESFYSGLLQKRLQSDTDLINEDEKILRTRVAETGKEPIYDNEGKEVIVAEGIQPAYLGEKETVFKAQTKRAVREAKIKEKHMKRKKDETDESYNNRIAEYDKEIEKKNIEEGLDPNRARQQVEASENRYKEAEIARRISEEREKSIQEGEDPNDVDELAIRKKYLQENKEAMSEILYQTHAQMKSGKRRIVSKDEPVGLEGVFKDDLAILATPGITNKQKFNLLQSRQKERGKISDERKPLTENMKERMGTPQGQISIIAQSDVQREAIQSIPEKDRIRAEYEAKHKWIDPDLTDPDRWMRKDRTGIDTDRMIRYFAQPMPKKDNADPNEITLTKGEHLLTPEGYTVSEVITRTNSRFKAAKAGRSKAEKFKSEMGYDLPEDKAETEREKSQREADEALEADRVAQYKVDNPLTKREAIEHGQLASIIDQGNRKSKEITLTTSEKPERREGKQVLPYKNIFERSKISKNLKYSQTYDLLDTKLTNPDRWMSKDGKRIDNSRIKAYFNEKVEKEGSNGILIETTRAKEELAPGFTVRDVIVKANARLKEERNPSMKSDEELAKEKRERLSTVPFEPIEHRKVITPDEIPEVEKNKLVEQRATSKANEEIIEAGIDLLRKPGAETEENLPKQTKKSEKVWEVHEGIMKSISKEDQTKSNFYQKVSKDTDFPISRGLEKPKPIEITRSGNNIIVDNKIRLLIGTLNTIDGRPAVSLSAHTITSDPTKESKPTGRNIIRRNQDQIIDAVKTAALEEYMKNMSEEDKKKAPINKDNILINIESRDEAVHEHLWKKLEEDRKAWGYNDVESKFERNDNAEKKPSVFQIERERLETEKEKKDKENKEIAKVVEQELIKTIQKQYDETGGKTNQTGSKYIEKVVQKEPPATETIKPTKIPELETVITAKKENIPTITDEERYIRAKPVEDMTTDEIKKYPDIYAARIESKEKIDSQRKVANVVQPEFVKPPIKATVNLPAEIIQKPKSKKVRDQSKIAAFNLSESKNTFAFQGTKESQNIQNEIKNVAQETQATAHGIASDIQSKEKPKEGTGDIKTMAKIDTDRPTTDTISLMTEAAVKPARKTWIEAKLGGQTKKEKEEMTEEITSKIPEEMIGVGQMMKPDKKSQGYPAGYEPESMSTSVINVKSPALVITGQKTSSIEKMKIIPDKGNPEVGVSETKKDPTEKEIKREMKLAAGLIDRNQAIDLVINPPPPRDTSKDKVPEWQAEKELKKVLDDGGTLTVDQEGFIRTHPITKQTPKESSSRNVEGLGPNVKLPEVGLGMMGKETLDISVSHPEVPNPETDWLNQTRRDIKRQETEANENREKELEDTALSSWTQEDANSFPELYNKKQELYNEKESQESKHVFTMRLNEKGQTKQDALEEKEQLQSQIQAIKDQRIVNIRESMPGSEADMWNTAEATQKAPSEWTEDQKKSTEKHKKDKEMENMLLQVSQEMEGTDILANRHKLVENQLVSNMNTEFKALQGEATRRGQDFTVTDLREQYEKRKVTHPEWSEAQVIGNMKAGIRDELKSSPEAQKDFADEAYGEWNKAQAKVNAIESYNKKKAQKELWLETSIGYDQSHGAEYGLRIQGKAGIGGLTDKQKYASRQGLAENPVTGTGVIGTGLVKPRESERNVYLLSEQTPMSQHSPEDIPRPDMMDRPRNMPESQHMTPPTSRPDMMARSRNMPSTGNSTFGTVGAAYIQTPEEMTKLRIMALQSGRPIMVQKTPDMGPGEGYSNQNVKPNIEPSRRVMNTLVRPRGERTGLIPSPPSFGTKSVMPGPIDDIRKSKKNKKGSKTPGMGFFNPRKGGFM